jgi:hypothetical protein
VSEDLMRRAAPFLARDEVAPLLAAMHGPPDVRVVAVPGADPAPARPSDWSELAQYTTWVIEAPESAWERTAVIEAAPTSRYVGPRARRQDRRGPGRPGPNSCGDGALADRRLPGDPAVLDALTGPNEPLQIDAAHRLSTIDAAGYREQIAERCRSAGGDSYPDVRIRLWLALALARAGDDAELRRMFDDLARAERDMYELHVSRPGEEFPGDPNLNLAS